MKNSIFENPWKQYIFQEKATQILALICEGFNADNQSSKNYSDKLEPQDGTGGSIANPQLETETSTPSPPSSARSVSSASPFPVPTSGPSKSTGTCPT